MHRQIVTLAPSKPGGPVCPRSPWKNNKQQNFINWFIDYAFRKCVHCTLMTKATIKSFTDFCSLPYFQFHQEVLGDPETKIHEWKKMRRNVRASMTYISESISYPITRVSGVSLGAWFTLNTLTLQHNHTNRPGQGNTFMDKQCTHFTKRKQNKKDYKQFKKNNGRKKHTNSPLDPFCPVSPRGPWEPGGPGLPWKYTQILFGACDKN